MTAQPRRPTTPVQDPDRTIGGVDLTDWPAFARPMVRGAHWLAARLGPYGTLLVPLLIGAVVFAVAAWAFGEVYESVLRGTALAALDPPALQESISLRSPALNVIVTGFTFLGGTVIAPIITVIVTGILVAVRRSWTPALVIVPAALGSLLMTIVGKRIFGRSRPPLADAIPPYEYSPSFPSGHSLNAIVIAGAVAYVLLLRRVTVVGRVLTIVIAMVYAIAMGLSRVYLGHHWLTDVIAAWVLGAAWLAVVITVHRLFLTVRHREPLTRAAPS